MHVETWCQLGHGLNGANTNQPPARMHPYAPLVCREWRTAPSSRSWAERYRTAMYFPLKQESTVSQLFQPWGTGRWLTGSLLSKVKA